MESVIAGIAEKSIIGAAFLYLLYYFVNRFSTTLLQIAEKMLVISDTLKDISNTLTTMDRRMESLEHRVNELEVIRNETVR